VDGVVLVSRCGKTTVSQAKQAANSLKAVGARLLGCVLNMAPTRGADAYTYYDYSRPDQRPQRAASTNETVVRPPERVSVR
jgi:Mrp family chromosome partitioning ATPase